MSENKIISAVPNTGISATTETGLCCLASKDLIKKTGNEVLEIPEGHICCGSAGTYNLLQSDIASDLLKGKIKNIEKIKPEIISTGNIGCITQISTGTNIPILHTIEIIDWYTGGPKPKVLMKI